MQEKTLIQLIQEAIQIAQDNQPSLKFEDMWADYPLRPIQVQTVSKE